MALTLPLKYQSISSWNVWAFWHQQGAKLCSISLEKMQIKVLQFNAYTTHQVKNNHGKIINFQCFPSEHYKSIMLRCTNIIFPLAILVSFFPIFKMHEIHTLLYNYHLLYPNVHEKCFEYLRQARMYNCYYSRKKYKKGKSIGKSFSSAAILFEQLQHRHHYLPPLSQGTCISKSSSSSRSR